MVAARVRRRALSCAGRPQAASTRPLQQRRLLGAVRHQLGVPLHAQAEARGRIPERLDGPVGRPRADLEAGADAVGGLVVERVDREVVAAGQPVQQRAVRDVDGVRRGERLVALEVVELAAVGEVLVQRPAARDVERLQPAADPEQRQVALGGAGQQRQLVLVGDAVDVGAERRVALLAVERPGRGRGRR